MAFWECMKRNQFLHLSSGQAVTTGWYSLPEGQATKLNHANTRFKNPDLKMWNLMYQELSKPNLEYTIKILTARGLFYQHQMILEHTFQLPYWSLYNKNNAVIIVIICVWLTWYLESTTKRLLIQILAQSSHYQMSYIQMVKVLINFFNIQSSG